MIGEKGFVGFQSDFPGRPADSNVQALHQAATRLGEMRRAGSRFRTKDLVALLLSHGARSWRNAQPLARMRIKAFSPDGRAAVRLTLP